MRTSLRTFVAFLFLLAMGTAVVFAATQNYLAKYDAGGALVDSAIYESGGNVGIGTTNPTANLEVRGTDAAGVHINASTPGTGIPFIRFEQAGIDKWGFLVDHAGNDDFGIYDYGPSYGYRLVIKDSTGYVGIGTTVPAEMLHVAGNVRVDGNIAAKYQDVAEWVDSVEPLEAGTIVVIDGSGDNRVSAAKQSYDPRVAGAISAAPGVVLGEPGRGKVLVAQSGRVRINADASYGAIQIGDLLVSSPTKGAAMRSEPVDVAGVKMHRPGTLIGKALESLDHGTGTILVLVTLQ